MVDKTQEQILALIAEIQREAYNDGYQRGWRDAAAKIMAAAQEGTPMFREASSSAPGLEADNSSPPQYSTPIIDLVYDIVSQKPGLRGHQIVKSILARDPSISRKVADRTGRTSLSRLRQRGKITQQDGRWYPATSESTDGESIEVKQKEPAVGSLALTEPGWRNG